MITVSKLEHNEKTEPPIDTTESGILILNIFMQFENAESPISFTFSPMITDSKLEHNEKTEPPIDVTESPMLAYVRSGHSENSPDVIELTVPPMITLTVELK
ncbi:hypothetical protein GPJ56_003638 [Histomonas meleagridis]|uniref:uncharacterized protein n=1 Tax=Histomonas meleagridis TaxID=135588 RepID=UPI00355AAC4E|nr:hypothetical protein GPJ56_003638 [Histomonas meleagridis]KAH0800708.1 hypothetical protein GO595_006461 [Histomonas meleagridis]